MTDITITPMTLLHIPAVAHLETLCFSLPWSAYLLQESMKTGVFWVALQGATGELCGYTGLTAVVGEGSVNNIAVAPTHRGCGIGKLLLDTMITYTDAHLEFLTLEVRPSNTSAIALYEGGNFKHIARRKNYYSSPKEDALIMTYYPPTKEN